jgi:hypothetical protein
MTGGVSKIIYPEELEKMTVEEIHEEIVKGLKTEDLTLGWKFKSKKRAEFLERAVYYCPKCGALNSIHTKGKMILCKECDFAAEYTEDLKIKKINGELFGETTLEWFNAQQEKLEEIFINAKAEEKLFSDQVEIRIVRGRERDKRGEASLFATKEKIAVSGEKIVKQLKFIDALGATVLGKRKINFYLDDGSIFQIKGSKRFNAVKYLHLYQLAVKGEKL